MANPKPFFVVNMGQLQAKLHLAAQQQVPNAIIINTAIQNPSAKNTPEKPGDSKFDFTNKTGEYEVAVVKKLSVQMNIDLKKNKAYSAALEEYKKFKEEHKPEDESATEKTVDTEDKELKPIQEKLLKIMNAFKFKEFKEDKEDFDATLKSFEEACESENKAREETFNKEKDKLQKEAGTEMQKYMIMFLGQEAGSKVKTNQLKYVNIDVDGKLADPSEFKGIKDFKIVTDDIDKELEKALEKYQEKPMDYFTHSVGFVAGYKAKLKSK